ncbi:MAG TPA: ABC transporter substrate-binding protein [Burkholderiaceae bacterium]|nr:ABC transporter substrate-binding protein [Burkholderiaceae bacterium]
MRKFHVLPAAVAAAFSLGAQAQGSDAVFRIGILNDQSGVYSYVTGRGAVEAARLAVEDRGGKVLGRRIEVMFADDQNKPDVAAVVARRWIDVDKVDLLVAGGGSATTIAVMNVAKEKNKTLLVAGAGSSDITGKLCAPNVTHWVFDTYGLAASVGKAVVADGGKSWYFVTADYSFGQALERDTTKFIEAGGGKVLGSVRHPLNASDFSSFLLQAQASKAQVIGLANAGGDLVNAVKQADEFGLTRNQRLAGLLLYVNDVQAIGLKTARGTMGVASFYHDQNDATRAWTQRYQARFPGTNIPNMTHAGAYAAVNHYLKAVEAAGTDDTAAVGRKMREMPVNDMYNKNVRIRTDGRVLHDMMLWQAKSPEQSKGPFDLLQIRQTVPGDQAFRPETEGGCPLVAGAAK